MPALPRGKDSRKDASIATVKLIENTQLFTWMVKDFFWLVLVPYISIPAGLAAMWLQIVMIRRDQANPSRILNYVGLFLWIAGNFIWMIAETLYDRSDADINMAGTPILKQDSNLYSRLTSTTGIIFLISMLVLFLDICLTSFKLYGKSNIIVSERFLSTLWVAKDICWLHSQPTGAVTIGTIALAIGLYCIGVAIAVGDIRGVFLACGTEIWLLAMFIWMCGEFYTNDSIRWLSAVVFTFGFVVLIANLLGLNCEKVPRRPPTRLPRDKFTTSPRLDRNRVAVQGTQSERKTLLSE